jgi:hypothetical protein
MCAPVSARGLRALTGSTDHLTTKTASPFHYLKLLNIALTSDPSSPSADHIIRPPRP